ncbi:MAG: threonylcarbamoyl-AMP synthase [Clostridia bacterium]|nr:threonylcarbamoyl-AMP synthase [Clostridia bacterium]
METKLLDAVKNYDLSVKTAADIIKSGGIVAIPTETVYGLAANTFDEQAIKKVFIAKGRPQDNPLITHISDMEMLERVAEDIPKIAYKLANAFWPGPFTMVLKRKNTVPATVSAGLSTIAVRMPSAKCAADIIKAAGVPLAAPSANLSGKPSPTRAADVIADLSSKIDAVVVGEDSVVGVESTVLSLIDRPRLLRPGGVTVEELKEILGDDLIIDKAVLNEPEKDKPVSSPGMKYKHYAPKTPATLIVGDSEKFVSFVNNTENAIAICFDEDIKNIKIDALSYGTNKDCKTLAKNVFTALREADKAGKEKIFVHAPDTKGVGLAVYNRLLRAAAFEVITL